jgi:hypothetical protein
LVGKARIGDFPRDALAFNRKRLIGRPGEATDASVSGSSAQTATAPQEDVCRLAAVKTGDSGSGVNFLSQAVVKSGSSVSIGDYFPDHVTWMVVSWADTSGSVPLAV